MRVFVEPQQFHDYQKVIPTEHLCALPENDKGLTYAMNQIGDYAARNGFEYVFKIDDDVYGFTGRYGARSNEQRAREKLQLALTEIEHALDTNPLLGAVGFPYHNELYEEKIWGNVNSRLQTCYVIRTRFVPLPPDAFEWSDFAHTLRVRGAGFATIRYGAAMNCCPVGGTSGGAQDFNRKRLAEASREAFMRLWPGLQWKTTTHAWGIEPDFRRTKGLGNG